uniref:helix-turn-helix domain-containing protein n=1 Tax=Trichocoleus desertorum TaxID=1481672 RepID=UPI0025B42FDB|nr:helix-turn-helix transcriptional regulator [Trichocoleus desertorum]
MATLTQAQPMIRWKLRAVMADRKMSATGLGKLLGVNRVTVSGWANSDEIPNFVDVNGTLNNLCFFLECTPDELIHYTRDEADRQP